ncbi:MAG: hypothetical protein Q8O56_13130 [Solirubrobacteraceae bacterium]|nr:hypothetical protein [Solirubrobacteraceae bacterium]
MRRSASPSRCARRLATALTLLGVASAAPASAATWRLEPIAAATDVAELHDLAFDAQGSALLSWHGAPQGRAPAFAGVASRDLTGAWRRPADLAGVAPAGAQIHLVGATRALLVAREGATRANRRRLVVADGRSNGGFSASSGLDEFVAGHWSDANARGDALVAWTVERSPFIRLAERGAGQQSFGAARDLAVGRAATVAINARGDRVLAWRAGRRLAARVRPAGGTWSPAVRFGRVEQIQGLALSALVARNGRVVVTWGSVGRPCGVSLRDGAGSWRTRTLERRCGPTGGPSRGAPVLALADSRGATYAAWTGRTRSGRRAVKLARVGPAASTRPLVLSRERGAVLDDVAAGPSGSLAITYNAPRPTTARPLLHATFAALRRGTGGFGRADRLTPANVFAAQGSRVAFAPRTGEPVVAVPYLVGRTVAVAAAVGPAARATTP